MVGRRAPSYATGSNAQGWVGVSSASFIFPQIKETRVGANPPLDGRIIWKAFAWVTMLMVGWHPPYACWWNPVKHGLVKRAVDWPYSSIQRDIRLGRCDPEWTGIESKGDFGE